MLAVSSSPSYAQSNLGRIFGAVTDQSGGAIVGAAVSVIDVDRGITRPLVTDGAGLYDASSIIPGNYTVRVMAMGFRLEEHAGIVVGVGKEVRVDLTLQPGEQTTTVTVTGDLPQVNTANAQLGGTLEQITVQELPVDGRNYQYLAYTRPGVLMTPSEGQNDFTSDNVGPVDWMIDGLMDSNIFIPNPTLVGGAQLGPDEATILPLDAIQEVNMVEFPNAQYGDRPSAHIDVGLKSGTNSLHGTAYAFGREQGLNAKNPFLSEPSSAPQLPKAPLTLEQFGASVGGPIKKDKVFFFANYEGQRYTAGVPAIRFEPTVADYNALGLASSGATDSTPDALYGILHNSPQTAGIPTVPPSALSMNLAGCESLINYPGDLAPGGYLTTAAITRLQGLTTAQLAAGCTGNPLQNVFGSASTLPSGQVVTDFFTFGGSDNGIIKVDVHANDRNQFNFVWYSGGGNGETAGANGASGAGEQYFDTDLHTWANLGRAVWIWTPSSTWLNEFRFGYDYGNYPQYALDCDKPGIAPNFYGAPPAGLGLVTGAVPCSPSASGAGHDVYGGYFAQTMSPFNNLGGASIRQDGFEHYYQILDNVTWTHGKHVISFGPEMRFNYIGIAAIGGDNGAVTFGTTVAAFPGATALEDFLTGTPSSGSILTGNPTRNTYYGAFDLYVQDAFRVTPRLTLNYGIRWEDSTPWSNPGKNPGANPAPTYSLGGFDPTLGSATDLYQETKSKQVYTQYPWNFGPRFGAAWDVFGNGKTVVHVSTSVMFYSSISGTSTLFSGGSLINAVPTGFTFYDAATPAGFAGPGNITTATLALQGGTPPSINNPAGAVGNNLPWTVGNAVFPGGSTAGFTCGDGFTKPTGGIALGGTKIPAPCQLQVLPTKFRAPYYFDNTLSVQHAFTNNLTWDVAYVRTHGSNLTGNVDENYPTPGANTTAIPAGGCAGNIGPTSTSPVEQCRRVYEGTFPFYGKILLGAPYAPSEYDGLQTSLTQRLSHGLQFTPGFTWSHSLSVGAVEDPSNPIVSWGQSGNPLVFTITGTYYLPSLKSPGQMLQGWQVNSTVYMLSSGPTTATDAVDDLSGLGGSGTDRWNLVGNPRYFQMGGTGPSVPCFGIAGSSFAKAANCVTVNTPGTGCTTITVATAAGCTAGMPVACLAVASTEPTNPNAPGTSGLTSLAKLGCYDANGAVIVPPAQGTLGNEKAGALYGKPYRNWDFSVSKNWKFKERYTVQFRAEFFNVLNRTLVSGAGAVTLNSPATFGQNTSTPDGSNPVIGNGPRKIQLGLKLGF